MRRGVTMAYLDELADAAGTDPGVRALWSDFRRLVAPEGRADVSDHPVDPRQVARIYTVRLEILRERARAIGGFEQSIEMLRNEPGKVLIGGVDADQYHGLYFLDSPPTRMVGFLYLDKIGGDDWSVDAGPGQAALP